MRLPTSSALLLAFAASCGGTTNPYQATFFAAVESTDEPPFMSSWRAGGTFVHGGGEIYWRGPRDGPCILIGSAPPYNDVGPKLEFVDEGPMFFGAGEKEYPLLNEGVFLSEPAPWIPGAPVTFRGEGRGDVPPFSIRAPTAPGTDLESLPPVHARGSDLVLRWTVGAATDIQVQISGRTPTMDPSLKTYPGLHAVCRLPAGGGSAVLPSSVLQRFRAEPTGFTFDAVTVSTHTIGIYSARTETYAPMKVRYTKIELQ